MPEVVQAFWRRTDGSLMRSGARPNDHAGTRHAGLTASSRRPFKHNET